MRPAKASQIISIETIVIVELLEALVLFIAFVIMMIILHEATHGLFFWLFTRSRPDFAFNKIIYAYTAAPGWYIPRNKYIVVEMAPLVLITTLGLILLAVAPQGWLLLILILTILNTCGSVGDMAVIASCSRSRQVVRRQTGATPLACTCLARSIHPLFALIMTTIRPCLDNNTIVGC